MAKLHRSRIEVEVNVRREASLCGTFPNSLGPVWIVVARQNMPVDHGKQFHALQRGVKRQLAWGFAVIYVASDEDIADAFIDREAADISMASRRARRKFSSFAPNCLNTLPICQSAE
jgi:hypothetical protein